MATPKCPYSHSGSRIMRQRADGWACAGCGATVSTEALERQAREAGIAAALKHEGIRRALNGLVGCPDGGWPETEQAMRRLTDELPLRSERAYTAAQLIHAALRLDHADRYRWLGEG